MTPTKFNEQKLQSRFEPALASRYLADFEAASFISSECQMSMLKEYKTMLIDSAETAKIEVS